MSDERPDPGDFSAVAERLLTALARHPGSLRRVHVTVGNIQVEAEWGPSEPEPAAAAAVPEAASWTPAAEVGADPTGGADANGRGAPEFGIVDDRSREWVAAEFGGAGRHHRSDDSGNLAGDLPSLFPTAEGLHFG